MSEILVERLERLEFATVLNGDVIGITTGTEDAAWQYEFTATDCSHLWPSGQLTATTPAGEAVGPAEFELHGCGRWTTPRQNPVQKQQGLAFTPYYEGIIVGSFLWGKDPSEDERVVFDKPGQEISAITHTPYKENMLLSILSVASGSMTVAEMIEILPETPPADSLTPQDVRTILSKLALRGHVTMLKNPYRFEATHLTS